MLNTPPAGPMPEPPAMMPITVIPNIGTRIMIATTPMITQATIVLAEVG